MSEKDQVTFTIDGQVVQAAKGTPILEAAKQLGIQIPHYCYHPGLSVVGNCRMCLVEIEKIPKLQPSCATPAADGMVVRTQSPEALRNRQSVLEFLLINHPLDCPVCDQAGECELQNYYMDHGRYDSRFNENKVKRKKAYPIGPKVILDQERCILCTRCVRFTKEISRTGELAVHDRGHFSEIDIFPGEELDNPYSGNVVDICPVGALTDRDFRFQCRVWFLSSTPTICPGCSRGCNIEIHANGHFNPRYHEKRVQRLKPRFNPDVNRYWMCDEGRYGFHSIDAADRLEQPRLRDGESWSDCGWDEALNRVAARLTDTLQQHGADAIGILASPQMTNEALFGVRRIFGDALGVSGLEFSVPSREAVYADDFLVRADKHPNTRGAEVLGAGKSGGEELLRACQQGRIRFLYVFHHDLTRGFDRKFLDDALAQVDCVVFQGSWKTATAASAHIQLPAAVYAESDGTFTNFQGRVQRIRRALDPLGEARSDVDILITLAGRLGLPLNAATPPLIFEEIAATVPAFSGMTYETLGSQGRVLS